MTEELGLTLIRIGDRRRQDNGDIAGLADSIREHGLLHPLVVDADDRLVAGGRRLEAVRELGWLCVPVTRLGDLTETQLREVELEENLRRKDLTPVEVSRIMIALAEVVGRRQTETRSIAERVYGTRGPAPEPASLRSVADEMGVSPQTIIRARDHVEAVDEHPELEPLPQAQAIREHRRLTVPVSDEALAEEQRKNAIHVHEGVVFAFGASEETARAVCRQITAGDTADLTPSRFEKAAAYAVAFADELRKAGVDG